MAEILLVNPRKRRKKARRNPRRRMTAKQRMYFGKRRKRNPVSIASKPRVLTANPRRRKRRATRRRATYRRNPAMRVPTLRGITGQIVPTLQDGFTGALGGLGLDVLLGFTLPKLPAALQTGMGRTATKVVGAVLVGVLGQMVMRGRGKALSTGAMTVVLHDVLREQLAAAFPNVPLGEYLTVGPTVGYDFEPALPGSTGLPGGVAGYFGYDQGGWGNGMGEYVTGTGSGMEVFDNGADFG